MSDFTSIKAADLQRIGISKPYAHQLAAGARSPSLRLALQIEAALGVPPTAWPLRVADSVADPDHPAVSPADTATLTVPPDCGAGKSEAGFPPARGVAV